MTEPEIPFANDARHSWHTADGNASGAEIDWIPGTKLDWAECLPFRQVRGVDVAIGPDHPFPGASKASGET